MRCRSACHPPIRREAPAALAPPAATPPPVAPRPRPSGLTPMTVDGTEHFLGYGKLGIDRFDLVGYRAHVFNESGRVLFLRFQCGNVC